MPRLTAIDPAQATGGARAIFDGPLKGKHFNIFKGMANSPAGLEVYLGMAGALAKASLSAAQREVIALAVSEANNCEYCLAAHTQIGQGAGLSGEQVVEARRGAMGEPRHDALVKFALALHEKRGFVSDDDLARFKSAGFNDGHVVEVVATYAHTLYTNMFNHVNQTEVDFPPVPTI
ncbi:MAG: carboxymuconolactone decarboxylase family protein [Phycisphaeraceae bacterium]|nr:carboxymuconolactone decarboxylase family protein [Phycisphaeraceae bacterium]